MATRFINIDRNTPLLLPPDLRDWVADDDMVHFVIEAVAVIIKNVMGFRQFLQRGLAQVSGEWSLVCLAYNVKRLYALRAAV